MRAKLGGEWNHLTSVLRELPNPLINFINKLTNFIRSKEKERKIKFLYYSKK